MIINKLRTLPFAVLYLCGAALLSQHASADHHNNEAAEVTVYVRTISATAPLQADANTPRSLDGIHVDSSLRDIQPKLMQLPFSSFKLLSAKQEQLSLLKKESLRLPNGQLLAFRPMYVDQKRVGLWLKWKDSDGAEILNTRVHFDTDDSVLTGTDSEHDSGLILAIKAVPVVQGKE
jgi:hypothetical protein